MKKKNRTSSPLKRCFCGLVALTMTLPLLSGCSGNDNGQQTSSGSSVSVVSSVQESTAPSVSDASASGEISQEESSHREAAGMTPLAWRVEDNDGHTIYMMGTIHFGDEAMDHLPDYFETAYQASDAIAVESDINSILQDSSKMMAIMNMMVYKDGTTIKDHISQDTYDRAVALLKDKKAYVASYDLYKPFLWQVLLTNAIDAYGGLKAEYGLDMKVLQRAKAENKTILEIEDPDDTFKMLDGLSDGLNELLMLEYLTPNAEEEQGKASRELYERWKSGTIDASMSDDMGLTIQESNKVYLEEYKEKILTDRNRNMVKTIEEYIQSGQKVFVLVGTLHFVGDQGIVKALEADGYTVTRLQ